LHQAPWLPANEPFNDNSYLWASLTRLHIDRGETAHARRVAQDVQNAGAIARMMIDRRFDGVIERAPAELVSLYEADLGRFRALTAAHPNRLEGVNRLAEALMELDRGEEAVALVDAALARADSRRGFEDQDEHLNWTRNHRAWALLSVGRSREAAEEMARGARLPERGGVNVSQLINLAELYLRLGRNEEAAATLNDLDLAQVSGYGWMNAHYVLACAKQELGAHAEAEAVLAQMRARRGDSKMILRGTELCFDHFDEAARLYIEDLDDAEERERTLLDAQTYIEPRHQTDFQRRMAARWKTLLARADVRAAVERHGRIIAFPVRPQNY
jgi:tetratricopeptide (TPR) repeat protein